MNKLIKLSDGILVEVDVPEGQVRSVSGGLTHKVNTTIDQLEPLLTSICRPVVAAWQEMKEQVDVEAMTIELGLSFEGEGNLFITKSKAAANLTITIALKPGAQGAPLLVTKE